MEYEPMGVGGAVNNTGEAVFRYTPEEQQHLQCLSNMCWCWENNQLGSASPSYWRHVAAVMRLEESEKAVMVHEGMHPDDLDRQDTAEDYEETADGIECGFFAGEHLP